MKRLLLLALLLTGCARPINTAAGPPFDPMSFFTGHVTSWGVEEDRAGAPIAIVTTDCQGTATSPHSIRMVQTLHVGNHQPITRIWQFTQTSQTSFTGTANDMDGQAAGTAAGPIFHWRWTLETTPRKCTEKRHHGAMDVPPAGRHGADPHDRHQTRGSVD